MNNTQQQILALAGLFQAMSAVDAIAQKGQCDSKQLETSLNSLFVTNPETTLSVYGELNKLETGLEVVHDLLAKTNANEHILPIRYALAIVHLERKLNKDESMLNTLGERLDRAQQQVDHFGTCHENVINGIASIYVDTISTFSLRVQISGQERHLSVDLNAARIRCLLLAGVRSAMLWRQLAGRRWHFIFKRKALARECESLLRACRHS
jgi:high frequency lysogenization protein